MGNRLFTFSSNEIYHCYNRGVDKRTIFEDQQDFIYFLKLLRNFNTSKVYGNLRLSLNKEPINPPVTILTYCLLPNHFHIVIRNNSDEGGLSKYIQRVVGGYTMYFNQKHKRSGALFQGTFKAKHIETDLYLRHILAYVRYNNIVHDVEDKNLYRSSLNTKDDLVRGLTTDLGEENMLEVVKIIKEIRSTRLNLVLEE
ncbi:MAG: transposase [Patescibacteria group bacterium]